MTRFFKVPTFYTLILTQTLSLIGSRISGLAIGIWVFNETGNATPLALVAFFATVPMVLASSISGVLADRWDRRYVMIVADAGQAVGTMLLLVSFATDGFQLWHLYAVTFIQAIFGVFQGPAFQASVTMLIPDNKRDRANAIQQMTGPAAGIIAPAIAGFVFAAVGVIGAIIIDMVTFFVAVLVILSVQIPRPKQTAEGLALKGSVWKEAWSGLRYLLSRRILFWMMFYVSLINLLFGGAMVLTTPYLLARTGDEAVLGVLLSVFNLGALIGGLIFSVWGGTRPRIHTMMPGVAASGLFLVLVGMGQTPLPLGVALFFMFLPLPMVNASFMSMIQVKVPPDVQGRVFAVLGQMSMMLTPLSYLLAGPLADQVFEPAVGLPGWELVAPFVGNSVGAGMGLIMVICGLFVLVSTLIAYALPAVRSMETTLPDYIPSAGDEILPDISPEAAPGLAN
jgi:MFS transporter, DHA3 family, macrolide efflux protein